MDKQKLKRKQNSKASNLEGKKNAKKSRKKERAKKHKIESAQINNKCIELAQKISDQEKEQKEEKEKLNIILSRNEELQKQVFYFKCQNAEKEQQIEEKNQLINSFEKKQDEINILLMQNKQLENKCQELEQKLDLLKKQNANTSAKLNKLQEDLKVEKVSAESLRKYSLYYVQKMHELSDKFIKAEKEFKEKEMQLNKEIHFTESCLQPYMDTVSEQSLQIINLEQKNKMLLSSILYLQDKEAAHKVQFSEILSEKNQLQEELILKRYLSEFFGTIAENAKNLISILPIHSCIRYPILRELTKGLQLAEASEFFGPSISSISKAKKQSNLEILDHLFHIERERVVYRINVKLIVDFWFENCPVPSGSKRTVIDFNLRITVPVYIQRVSTVKLHNLYCERNSADKVCIVTFLKYKPFNVKMGRLPTKADLIDSCPHCLVLKELREKEKSGQKLTPQEEKIKKQKEYHLHCSIEQMRYYITLRSLVESNIDYILVIQDFTKFYINGVRYNDLMISVLSYDPKSGKHRWIYLDFIEKGGGSNQDYFFVRSVWRYLLGVEQLACKYMTSSEEIDPPSLFKDKRKFIFSDGAPQHFKQKKTVSFWAVLQMETGVALEIHFYASYHGHNVCDAHASHMKIKILRIIREIGLDNFKEENFLLSISMLKNTHLFYFEEDTIDRNAELLDVQNFLEKPLTGIRSLHHFLLVKEGEKYCFQFFKLSSDEEPFKIIELPTQEELLVKKLEKKLALMQKRLSELEALAKQREQSTNQQNLSQTENSVTISEIDPKGKEEKDGFDSDLEDDEIDFAEENGADDDDFFPILEEVIDSGKVVEEDEAEARPWVIDDVDNWKKN